MARSIREILSEIHSMSEEIGPKDLFAMIYAEFGVGKTTTTMGLAQALRGDQKILFFDSSDGWVSLEEFPSLMEGTDRFQVKDPAELVAIANALATKSLTGYSVIVIDELSSIFDEMVEQYLRQKYGLTPDEQIPEAEGRDYGPPTAALASLLRKFHSLDNVHLIVTAHAREVQAEGGAKEIRASFPPKAYAEVMRKVHVTAALTARRKRNPETKELDYVRTLQLKPSAAVAAKSRIRNSPVTATPQEFIELVVDWINSSAFVTDTQNAELEGLVDNIEHEPEPQESDDTNEEVEDVFATVDETKAEWLEGFEDIDEAIGDVVDGVLANTELAETDRAAELETLEADDLRKIAIGDYDLDVKGLRKPGLIKAILKHEYDNTDYASMTDEQLQAIIQQEWPDVDTSSLTREQMLEGLATLNN